MPPSTITVLTENLETIKHLLQMLNFNGFLMLIVLVWIYRANK